MEVIKKDRAKKSPVAGNKSRDLSRSSTIDCNSIANRGSAMPGVLQTEYQTKTDREKVRPILSSIFSSARRSLAPPAFESHHRPETADDFLKPAGDLA